MPATLAEPEVQEVHDDGEGPLFEVVDGVRVEKPMSALGQWVGGQMSRLVGNHIVEDEEPGYVAPETFVACFEWSPGTQRRPDVAYWHYYQLPEGPPLRGVVTEAPAWCVEVVSPNDSAQELDEKIADYFRAGVRLVWTVHLTTRTIRAEQPDGSAHVYRAPDTITADPVLPNFSAKVADFFPRARPAE